MKTRLPFFKRAVPIALVLALDLALSACESGKNQVTEFKIRNDRVGTEVSFNLPGSEEDWEVVDHQFGTTSEDISYYPKGDDLDGTNSWSVQAQLSAEDSFYKEIVIDGEEPVDDSQSVVESDSGMRWLKTTGDGNYNCYVTCLDKYLNGYHTVEFIILPNGQLEDGQEPDKELFDKIEKTILNSLKYDSAYEGKPDYSDGAYTGTHQVKWPFEIPFESSAIKVEEFVDDNGLVVRFKYESPENPSVVYRIELIRDFMHNPEESDGKSYINEHFVNNEDPYKEEGFEVMKIADYEAAMRFNQENIKDEVVIEIPEDKVKQHLVLDMFTFIDSDTDADKGDEKNKQKIIDMAAAIAKSAEFIGSPESGADENK